MQNNIQKPWWQDSMESFLKIASWITGPILVGVILGNYIDIKLNTAPWIQICLTAILFGYSIYHMIQDVKKYQKNLEK